MEESTTAGEYLLFINEHFPFWSKERPKKRASRSELRRWCERKSVFLNGAVRAWSDIINLPITSFVLFPKGKSRITLV